MRVYQAKAGKLKGTDFYEVRAAAMVIFKRIKNKSKRRTYVRSVYFKKHKIFLDLFWEHLFDKSTWWERMRRLRYFEAAIEIIIHCHFEPKSKENPNRRSEILHRFSGLTKEGDLFYVQIKESKKSGEKFFISCFPDQ